MMRRLFCWILGHRRDSELWRRVYPADQDNQRPGRTYVFEPCGHECARCGKRLPA